jgi:N utilization substance protein A
VPFSEDPAEFVMRALQPAKVREVRLDDMTGVATVVVNDYQLSLAIGREGQNARLAGRLTGWEIQIKSESQLAEEEAGYAEGEWVEKDGEMLWQPADGGEALSAEAYYAEASAEPAAEPAEAPSEEAVTNEDVADLAPPVDDATPEAVANEDPVDLLARTDEEPEA